VQVSECANACSQQLGALIDGSYCIDVNSSDDRHACRRPQLQTRARRADCTPLSLCLSVGPTVGGLECAARVDERLRVDGRRQRIEGAAGRGGGHREWGRGSSRAQRQSTGGKQPAVCCRERSEQRRSAQVGNAHRAGTNEVPQPQPRQPLESRESVESTCQGSRRLRGRGAQTARRQLNQTVPVGS